MTTEALLNLLWVVVTLTSLWLWRFRWTVSRKNPRVRIFEEMVALVCALALLFPVISLTDDLHPETLAVDASSGKRNSSLLVAGVTRTPHIAPMSGSHSAIAIIRGLFERPNLDLAAVTLPSQTLQFSFVSGASPGRSPPASH